MRVDRDKIEEFDRFMWFILCMVAVIMVGFFFMVSSLFVFHTYLISMNLTTCKSTDHFI